MTQTTCTQFCVPIPNTPGTLGKLTQALSKEGCNITGIMIEDLGDVSYVRFNADDEGGVRKVLKAAGYQVFETPAFCVEVPNRPGELHKLAKSLGEQGVNIRHIYGTTDGAETCKLMVIVDQTEKAQSFFKKFGEKMENAVR